MSILIRFKGLTCITYGTEDEAELYVSGKAGICAPFLTFEWRHEDRRHKVSTHLIGSYNLKNALAAIAIGRFSMYQKKIFQKHWKNIFHTTIARSLPQLPTII